MTDPLSDSLRWALQFGHDPAVSAADWLTRELAPEFDTADRAIREPASSDEEDIKRLKLLKSGFKTLRLTGETAEDRRAGARYYAAVLAAAIVRHGIRISSQRTSRIQSALRDLEGDNSVSTEIQSMSRRALDRLDAELIPEECD